MEAIILAGGFGTRLKTIVSDVPKPMAQINGQPFLAILLNSLSKKGFSRIILSLGHMANIVTGYFGDSFAGMELIYEIEKKPLGTGGAIRQALTKCLDDHVYILNGDTFSDLEVSVIERHWKKNKHPIIVARKVEDRSRFGSIKEKEGQVINFAEKEKQGPGLINAGCYVFPSSLLDKVKTEVFSIEAEFLVQEIHQQRFDLFITQGKFIDIGIPAEYKRAQHILKEFL